MEDLLGSSEAELMSPVVGRQAAAPGSRARFGWSTAEDGPVRSMAGSSFAGMSPSTSDDPRLNTESLAKPRTLAAEATYAREGELMSKLHELLHSPFGECITDIVDDLHRVLSQVRNNG